MFDTIIRGGQVVCEGSTVAVDIGISNGCISALLSRGTEATASQVIDAAGKLVVPGVVDAHVHFAVPGEDEVADNFESAAISAAYGGVTTIMPFIWTRADPGVVKSLERVKQEGERTSVLDFSLHCILGAPDQRQISEIPNVVAMGITSVKVFMAYRKRGIMIDDYYLLALADALARAGGILMAHCEDGLLIDYLEDKLLAEGRYGPLTFLSTRPGYLEASSIARLALMAKMTGCRTHVVHLSAKEGLQEILRARADGVKMSTETCPQYLVLTDALMAKMHGLARIGPPLREEADLEAMWEGLRSGAIEMIGSDHAPQQFKNKNLPDEQFTDVPYGMPGVETMLPVVYSEGVVKGELTLERMVETLCAVPAKLFGIYPQKGTIKVGSDADVLLLDPSIEWQVTAKDLHSRSGYTPYEGWKLQGRPVMSMLRGQILLKDGQLHQSPGYGRFLPRKPTTTN